MPDLDAAVRFYSDVLGMTREWGADIACDFSYGASIFAAGDSAVGALGGIDIAVNATGWVR